MEKLSQLAFHPVKMQSCYEKMDQLKLEGLQQRFDVSSASVFKQRAQILMRQVRGCFKKELVSINGLLHVMAQKPLLISRNLRQIPWSKSH